jgi:hypothetical protein
MGSRVRLVLRRVLAVVFAYAILLFWAPVRYGLGCGDDGTIYHRHYGLLSWLTYTRDTTPPEGVYVSWDLSVPALLLSLLVTALLVLTVWALWTRSRPPLPSAPGTAAPRA